MRLGEEAAFKAFIAHQPDFAGRAVDWQDGTDPPDVLCIDQSGKRIGIELAEWLNEDQMQASKIREGIEESYEEALNSRQQQAPANIGLVWLSSRMQARLRKSDYEKFRNEMYDLITEVNNALDNEDRWNGKLIREFGARPTVKKYLSSIRVFSSNRFNHVPDFRWVGFPPYTSSYSPDSAIEALVTIINKKIVKYDDLHQREELDELYLLIYYSQAWAHNTPYDAPNFGFKEIAQRVRNIVRHDHGQFQKIFLFNSLEGLRECAELWSSD